MTLHLFDLSGGLLKSSSSQQGVVHQPSRPHIVSRVEGESLSAIDFLGNSSSSSIRIAGALENYRRLVIFELKKTDGEKKKSLVEVYRGEVALQKNRVRWLVASKGASHQWICTASEEDDTEIHVWSVSGECLASVDTKQVQTFQFSSSPLDTR
ncbi:tbl2-prov related, partial [Cystoisospora suis]